jgi:hypothetical protein
MRSRPFAPVLVLAAALLPAVHGVGCGGGGGGGPAAPPADPAIVGISPTEVWRTEASTLTITGVATGWSAPAPPPIDPGPGIVVDSLTVDSATRLTVAVHVAYDAPLGDRRLRVRVGAAMLPTPELKVRAPISASWFSQPFVRSSVLVGVLAVNRPGDVVDGPVVATASDGSPLPMFFDDPNGFIVVLPEDAPLGVFDLYIHRTGSDGSSMFRLPGGPIAQRAVVLTSFPIQISLPTVDGPALHRYTATVDGLLEFPMTSSDPTLPIHFLYPHESPFAPPIVGKAPLIYGTVNPGPRAAALAGETFDVIVFSGHTSYGIDVRETAAPRVAEAEPDDLPAAAQELTLPALVSPATIDAATGVDWYAFAAAPADVGKLLRVVASPGPSLSISVFRADQTATLGGASASGHGAAVDLRTSAIPAEETIYVRVSSQATPADPDVTTSYRLFLRLESP